MPAEIKNVFVLMLENRSFDHMLGFSGITGTDAATGKPTQINGLTGDESNGYLGLSYPVGRGFHEPIAVGPAHEFMDVLEQLCGTQSVYNSEGPYPPINNSGFVSNYARSHSKDEWNVPGDFGQVMDAYTPDQLPVLNALAKTFAICDGWHSSLPGPTFPNRLFAMGASSNGLDHSPSTEELLTWDGLDGYRLPHGSIFDVLKERFADEAWRIYAGSHFPLVSALNGINTFDVRSVDDLANDLKGGPYPYRLTWIEPDYGDMVFGTFRGGTSQHPMDNIAGGESLIKEVYEAVRGSPLWESSLLIVTWDEHGGFYDHVSPGKAVAPGNTQPESKYNQYGFTFRQLGVRVPAVIVSSRIPAGTIDHRPYDHSAIPKTLETVFGLAPLTKRDQAANSLGALLVLNAARSDAPLTLPLPASRGQSTALVPRSGDEPVDNGNLPLFLHIAARHELALCHPARKPAVLGRVRSIRTRAQADQYMHEITERVELAKRSSASLESAERTRNANYPAPEIESVSVIIDSGPVNQIRVQELTEFLRLFRAAYVAAFFHWPGVPPTSSLRSDALVETTRKQPSDEDFVVSLRSVLRTMSPLDVAVLVNSELQQVDAEIDADLTIETISLQSPLLITFRGIAAALAAAVILSGGSFALGPLHVKLPPLGRGIMALRDAFNLANSGQEHSIGKKSTEQKKS